jgi:hypothetical protein
MTAVPVRTRVGFSGTTYQNGKKLPDNKIAMKYTKYFHSMAFQGIPKLGFLKCYLATLDRIDMMPHWTAMSAFRHDLKHFALDSDDRGLMLRFLMAQNWHLIFLKILAKNNHKINFFSRKIADCSQTCLIA